jgi:hypothetical protein
MKFAPDRPQAMTELKELRDLCDRLRPDGGGYTIRQGGQDITVQERARLQARILDLEASLKGPCLA